VPWYFQDPSGDVALAENSALALGRDLVINGGFDADTDWTKGTGWSIAGGVASCDGSQVASTDLFQDSNNSVAQSRSYEITFTVSNYSAGSVTPRVGGTIGTVRSANGTFTETLVSGTDDLIRLFGNVDFIGDIDNVIVRQTNILASSAYPGAELLVDGDMEAAGVGDWTASANVTISKETGTPHSGTRVLRLAYGTGSGFFYQSVIVVGKRYRITGYTRSDGGRTPRVRTQAGVDLWVGTTSTDWQSFDFEFLSAGTYVQLYTSFTGAGQYTEWDDVSITEANPLNADTTGATVAQPGPAGLLAYSFDGSNDYVDAYSAELNSMFDPTQGTLLVAAKVSGASVWTDGVERRCITLRVDGNNRIYISKFSANNTLRVNLGYGAINEREDIVTSTTDWFLVGMTWDTNFKAYLNGVQQGSTQAIGGTWVGNLATTTTTIGAGTTTPTLVWDGLLTVPVLYTDVLTGDEILQIAKDLGVA
jgi:hypothetical protein